MGIALIKVDGATQVMTPSMIEKAKRRASFKENQSVARSADRFPPVDKLVDECLRSPMMALRLFTPLG